jgi:heterotetrameric sarcosine oxidase delta subunit
MRITCPYCGDRGSEEFHYHGAAGLPRPEPDAPVESWTSYVYLRDNPAGRHDEYWQHQHGCREWLVVTRDTRNHSVIAVQPARQA